MDIRYGRQADKQHYLEVQKEAFPGIDSERDSKFFDLKVQRKEIFVLEDEGYVGHICFGRYLYSPPFIDSVFVEEFAVRKELRGRGYGTKLLDELFNLCKREKISSVYLGTEDRSDNIVGYYEKLGFKIVGRLEDIVPGEYEHDQIFMARAV